jgi:surface-anchored protein
MFNVNHFDFSGHATRMFLFRSLLLVAGICCAQGVFSRHLAAETPILIEGHVDIGVIYSGGNLAWRFNADGASSEGGGVGDLEGLYAANELFVRVPDSRKFSAPSVLPGNPLVTGSSETGTIWWLPSSGGLPQVPFLGWSWDLALTTPPQLNLSQWQNGRITVELVEAKKPQDGNVSIWVGATNYISTYNPGTTNAPSVPSGSNSFVLPSHDHFNWGFTAAGIYDLTMRAWGTHLVDGFRETEATFRFLVGDQTSPQPEASVVAVHVYHSSWSGGGDKTDIGRVFAREGEGPQTLGYDNLINSLHGINGMVFEIEGVANPNGLSVNDFSFQMSPPGLFDQQAHPVEGWQVTPTPSSLTVLPGSPTRVIIHWPDRTIENRWLRATILPGASTGLSTAQTYYLGHLLGETTGPSSGVFTVTFADITAIRSGVGQSVAVTSMIDIDKNGTVSFADISAMRPNVGAQLTTITIP